MGDGVIPNTVKRRFPLEVYVEGAIARVRISGRECYMDTEDLPMLDGWTLSVTNHGYVALSGTVLVRPRVTLLLSRHIMQAPPGTVVDHVSGDTLDNRKANLRICKHSENVRNSRKHRNCKSRYKGVYYSESYGGPKKWRAELNFNGRRVHAGCYMTEEQAIEAYNTKALELFGAFARINILGDPGNTTSAATVDCASKAATPRE